MNVEMPIAIRAPQGYLWGRVLELRPRGCDIQISHPFPEFLHYSILHIYLPWKEHPLDLLAVVTDLKAREKRLSLSWYRLNGPALHFWSKFLQALDLGPSFLHSDEIQEQRPQLQYLVQWPMELRWNGQGVHTMTQKMGFDLVDFSAPVPLEPGQGCEVQIFARKKVQGFEAQAKVIRVRTGRGHWNVQIRLQKTLSAFQPFEEIVQRDFETWKKHVVLSSESDPLICQWLDNDTILFAHH